MIAKIDKWSRNSFQIVFCTTLSLMLIDWAVELPFSIWGIGVYEVSFLLLAVDFFIRLAIERGDMIHKICGVVWSCKWSLIFLCAYLVMGIITLFYAQAPGFAATKYIVVVQMLFFAVCLFYFNANSMPATKMRQLDKIYACLGVTAVIITAIAIAEHFAGKNNIYFARISPLRDYNQYTTILLICLICVAFFLLRAPLGVFWRYLCLGIVCASVIPAIYVAGSRRSYLILIVAVFLLFAAALVCAIKRLRRNEGSRRMAEICGILICVLVTFASTQALDRAVLSFSTREPVNNGTVENTTDDINHTGESENAPDAIEGSEPGKDNPLPPQEESSVSAVYESISDGSAMGKRRLIWNVAIDRILHSDPLHLLIGYGASYSSDLYDDMDNPLVEELYSHYRWKIDQPYAHWMNTHNLFLQDMLEGGILLLGLQLAVIFCAIVYTLKVIQFAPLNGIALGLIYSILLITFFLSSARGMISNKFFWLVTAFQFAECYDLKRKAVK